MTESYLTLIKKTSVPEVDCHMIILLIRRRSRSGVERTQAHEYESENHNA